MSNFWRRMFIQPTDEVVDPIALDEHLQENSIGGLLQQSQGGKKSYVVSEDGLFEVRLTKDSVLSADVAEYIMEQEGFTLVREEIYNVGELLETIEHLPPETSDFPGRRK